MLKTLGLSCSAPLRLPGPPRSAGQLRAGRGVHLGRRPRGGVVTYSSIDQASNAVSAVVPELQTFAQELVARAESVDNVAVQTILHQPLLTLPIAALFVTFSPKLIQVASKRFGTPVLAAMVGWLVLTHPSALIQVLTDVEAAAEAQPVGCSLLILLLATLTVAPYVMMGAGTAAGAWIVALVVQQEGWVPEQWAPAAVPLRTIQAKWDVAAQEAQQRGVAPPPSLPAPDLSAIVTPNIQLPALPSIPVPQLPASPIPSWALNAIPKVPAPALPEIHAINLDLTALKETIPTLSLPVTVQDMPWANQGFTLPWENKGFTWPWEAKPQGTQPVAASAAAVLDEPSPALVLTEPSPSPTLLPAPEAAAEPEETLASSVDLPLTTTTPEAAAAEPPLPFIDVLSPVDPAPSAAEPPAEPPIEIASQLDTAPPAAEAPATMPLPDVEAEAVSDTASPASEEPADSPSPIVTVVDVADASSPAAEAVSSPSEAPTEPVSVAFVADE